MTPLHVEPNTGNGGRALKTRNERLARAAKASDELLRQFMSVFGPDTAQEKHVRMGADATIESQWGLPPGAIRRWRKETEKA